MDASSEFINVAPFCCSTCKNHCAIGAGLILPKCLHAFCVECIHRFVFDQLLGIRCPNYEIFKCEATVSAEEMAAMQIFLARDPLKIHTAEAEIVSVQDTVKHAVYVIPGTANSKEEGCIEDKNESLTLDTFPPRLLLFEDLFKRQNTSNDDEEVESIPTVPANTVENLIDKTIITENILEGIVSAEQFLLAREPLKMQTAEEIAAKEILFSGSLPIFEYEINSENNKTILKKHANPVNIEAEIVTVKDEHAVYDMQRTLNSKAESCIEDKNESPALDTSLPGNYIIEDLFKRHNTSNDDEEVEKISTVPASTVENLIDKTIITENILDCYKVDIFLNTEEFLCPLCLQLCLPGDGMLLQNCSDPVCQNCMKNEILKSNYSLIKCPYYNCFGILNHCEIRCLLSTDDFEIFIQRSVRSYTDEPSNELASLMQLDEIGAIRNRQPFDCAICCVPCTPGDGIILRNCLHEVCAACLLNWVNSISSVDILCPLNDCSEIIEERELAALMTDVQYEQFRANNLRLCEQMLPGTYHCGTKDCPGFCFIEDNSSVFTCSVCNVANCIICQQFASIRERRDEDSSIHVIRAEIEKRLTMQCPKCKVPIQKISGCAHLHCLMCKSSFNWAY